MALHFPVSTEFNKRIPKYKFYEQEVPPVVKRAFVQQLGLITWRNKLAATTMNIAPGETVTEIEVFTIKLTQPQLDEGVLRQIDRSIPYHILFLLSYEGKVQAWIGHKEATEGGNKAYRVNRYYHTDWMMEGELELKIEGLNMDAVWENFIIQIGNIEVTQGKSLNEQIELDEQKAKLQKEIERLEKQARREKQPRKKFEIVERIRELKAIRN